MDDSVASIVFCVLSATVFFSGVCLGAAVTRWQSKSMIRDLIADLKVQRDDGSPNEQG